MDPDHSVVIQSLKPFQGRLVVSPQAPLSCSEYFKIFVNNTNETALSEAGLNGSAETAMGESVILIMNHQL